MVGECRLPASALSSVPTGLLPLPVPERGGSIEALRSFLNLSNRNDFVLVVAWLLAALRSGGPYPLLAISGEQGSAKTVLSKMLKALVDPNAAPVRALPREERELMIAANNGYVLAFDNLSGLPAWLSDALCRLASGGSFAVRQLYTDDDEVLFHATRPSLLNGIEDVISRPDLADRSIFLTLAPIAEAQRQSERDLWHQFELARPCILGALLDERARAAHPARVRLIGCRGWPTSRSGQRPAKRLFGHRGPSAAPMKQTAGPRSRALSMPIPSPLACGRSWPSAARGQAAPTTFCGRRGVATVRACRATGAAGRKIPARLRAACVARRRFCGHWASTYL